ncbi:hypothetical protein SAMN04487869_1532 [Marinobacter sp. DSM 26671]|jgi:hypothetical protein|uniref:hypothetical protein n=1 Tax=Marinobacter sp. DSM 26671 TaxID=1761793 RepID=UPI0008E49680|nr:hypothetical protein [Marinobacter sp. DSM 26671]SFF05065.1 hypothetical protein SAMN04487869_1532 [Marinobacter sp. DSM 26671]
MAANTAFMQIGQSHPNHGGVHPEAMLSFSEGDRPAWQLRYFSDRDEDINTKFSHIWIPTRGHTLEDGLLMAACFLESNSPIHDMIASHTRKFKQPRFDLSKDIEGQFHQKLLNLLQEATLSKKYVIHLLDRSYLRKQLGSLYMYSMNLEVTMSIYRREFSSWGNDWFTQGALPIVH